MEIKDLQFDERSSCCSILTIMTLEEYKTIAMSAFRKDGNILGQRDVLKSSAASKIRKRMIEDFNQGAIFPSVVIGIETDEDDIEILKKDESKFNVTKYDSSQVSIIDGMQRSNIYFTNYAGNENRKIRVEFWVTDKSVMLLYRMLVLNTGQVPWNTRRQIEVIFSSLSKSIINNLYERHLELTDRVEIMTIEQSKRRSQAGKYQNSVMITLFLGFNTRTVKVEVNDQLADEYQRLDMMNSIDTNLNYDLFVDVFAYLCKLDLAFAECSDSDGNGQFSDGKSIFSSTPACLGFVVACSEFLMGKINVERSDDEKLRKNIILQSKITQFIDLLKTKSCQNFLALDRLNEEINNLPKRRLGDEMRNLFKQAFIELIRYDNYEEIPSMETFWRG